MKVREVDETELRSIESALQQCIYHIDWREKVSKALGVGFYQVRVEPFDPFRLGEDEGCTFHVYYPSVSLTSKMGFVTVIALKKTGDDDLSHTVYNIYLIDQLDVGTAIQPIPRERAKMPEEMSAEKFRELYYK